MTSVAAAAALAASDADAPAGALLPLALFGGDATVTSAVILAFAALLVATSTAAFFVYRGVARGFTPATMALIGVGALAIILQVVETVRSHTAPPLNSFYVLRNIWMALSTLGLNLLQIQVAAIFQGSLIRLWWLERGRLCAHSNVAGEFAIFSGMYAFYALLVGACGITLNTFILISGLIVLVVLLDIAAFVSFAVSLPFASGDDSQLYNGLVQISQALFGLRTSAETIMFERVEVIFRSKMPRHYLASVGYDDVQLVSNAGSVVEGEADASSLRRRGGQAAQQAVALEEIAVSRAGAGAA
ncbi:hypothetical protein HK105_206550 [Polyrhizophydium stewartii]|uniref:Uncharacterized protein n=1 Tax=Polyrhizophydium stewartii TaxID=2732419 RepID=A0ABR4N3C1_9FUNG